MTTTLTPFDRSAATKTGRRTFRKQVLPKTEINYKGQKITFDDAYLQDLVQAFKDGAYDQVPFVFATPDNQHNEAPENFRGEIKGLELANDGLDMIVEVTKDGAKALKQNPNLGVSARIREGIERADGKTFKRAVRHVLATMDPRITGMRGWQAVDLSGYDGADTVVVDLTAAEYKETPMAKASKGKGGTGADAGTSTVERTNPFENVDLSALSDEDFQALLDLASDVQDDATTDLAQPVIVETPGPDTKDGKVVGKKGKKGKKKRGKIPPEFLKGSGADLSNDVKTMQKDLAQDRWRNERRSFMQSGVPKAMIDLAEPLLSAPEHLTIDLSDDQSVDATEIVRGLLTQAEGMIDLTPSLGHQQDVDLSQDDKDPVQDALKAWDEQYPA